MMYSATDGTFHIPGHIFENIFNFEICWRALQIDTISFLVLQSLSVDRNLIAFFCVHCLESLIFILHENVSILWAQL